MTLNFGHKILITFILFGGFIFYLVYRTTQVNVDLVTKDYYEKELKYQEVIDASKNASSLGSRMTISQEGNKIVLQLPAEFSQQGIKGSIHFYCAADAAKDREMALATDGGGRQEIGPDQHIPPGPYRVKVSWTAGSKAYYEESYLEYHP